MTASDILQSTYRGYGSKKALHDPTATTLFIGEDGATAIQDALALAKAMASQGADRDAIWRATHQRYGQGWFLDNGRWNYESKYDRQSADRNIPPNMIGTNASLNKNIMRDAGSEAAYPDIADTQARMHERGSNGNTLGAVYFAAPNIVQYYGRPTSSTFMHERQHQIDILKNGYGLPENRPPIGTPYYDNPLEKRAYNAAGRDIQMTDEAKAKFPPWTTEPIGNGQIRKPWRDIPTNSPEHLPIMEAYLRAQERERGYPAGSYKIKKSKFNDDGIDYAVPKLGQASAGTFVLHPYEAYERRDIRDD